MVVSSDLRREAYLASSNGSPFTRRQLQNAAKATKLDFRDRNLTDLPWEIGQFTNLRELDLSYNQLTSLPSEIGQLVNLKELNLYENKLDDLPPEIGRLVSLKVLNIHGNQLSTLPTEIGELANLVELYLGQNKLTVLPSELVQLRDLQDLMIFDNKLTTLPPNMDQLANLLQLVLGGNRFGTFIFDVTRLTKLERLEYGNCRLTELPSEINRLANLKQLELRGNQLTSLPPEIFQLPSLLQLDLNRNQLTTFPREVSQLSNLESLNLGSNQLTALPPELFQLAKLHNLYLRDNKLTALPPEINQLTKLEHLDVSSNQLTTLPRQLAELLDADLQFSLNSNPLIAPFPEFLALGAKDLAVYLRSLRDAVPLYEAKLLLVGEGNVGKTSLVAALRDEPFIEGRETTHGIEVEPIFLHHPSLDEKMTLRAWDFGGQEVYRISHQFFFSRRSLYLIVWNAREGQEQNEVEGWLRRIRLRVSREAYALVVATHCAERRPELDYPQLKRTFQDLLVGKYEVDNFTGAGIPELHEGIAREAARLPQMGMLISPRWIAARNAILTCAQSESHITYTHFANICKHNGLDANETGALAELMHDLGQIIYYGNDEGLRDFVVLDAEWLTKAISYILEDKLTRQANGVLDHSRLREIWPQRGGRPTYPIHYHPYFLRLMEKFDVSYRLEDDEYRSLVAQLVPHDRPDLPWTADVPPGNGIRRLALVCQFSEPVPGLVAWLTVRHHRASIGKHWRNGVFLRHPIAAYASEALLELRTAEQLTLDVRAPSPDMYFNVLRDSIEDLITRRWPGLRYRLLIPCPTRGNDGYGCSGQFPLNFLLSYRERGGVYVPCQECCVDRDISELLTGFAQTDLPLQFELEQLHNHVVDIGSGIKRLEGGVDRLEGYAAETADSVRRVMRAVGSEITDCPRLFSLSKEDFGGILKLRKLVQDSYTLVLWCEHPGHWHPWLPASYRLSQPKDWLVRIGPYADLVFKTLRVVVPIAASVGEMVLTDEQLKHAQRALDSMTILIEGLPDQTIDAQRELPADEHSGSLTPAQGQAARALRTLLFRHDHTHAFGDMRRMQAPSGDFVWVCPDHSTEYDPGLPNIPAT